MSSQFQDYGLDGMVGRETGKLHRLLPFWSPRFENIPIHRSEIHIYELKGPNDQPCNQLLESIGSPYKFLDWKVVFESQAADRGVRLIAESAIAVSRFQSYVAIGYPSWCSRAVDFGNGLA
ncbi:hypothetical protein DY000_02024045 [Brassica cretica]|uniref:Ycf2 N-terminal domain-containing protein n=1 Tax=Brassica cretica TaxID=69181 RepID=A0ABQ7E2Z4_BRACR|nr:hypothetical protein DY000_02024045 [Brassica cretica]